MHRYGTHLVLLLWSHQLKQQLVQNIDFDLLIMSFPFLELQTLALPHSEAVHKQ